MWKLSWQFSKLSNRSRSSLLAPSIEGLWEKSLPPSPKRRKEQIPPSPTKEIQKRKNQAELSPASTSNELFSLFVLCCWANSQHPHQSHTTPPWPAWVIFCLHRSKSAKTLCEVWRLDCFPISFWVNFGRQSCVCVSARPCTHTVVTVSFFSAVPASYRCYDVNRWSLSWSLFCKCVCRYTYSDSVSSKM